MSIVAKRSPISATAEYLLESVSLTCMIRVTRWLGLHSTGSHDLLQWVVGLQQQHQWRRLFMLKAEITA